MSTMRPDRASGYCPFCEAAELSRHDVAWFNKPIYETPNFTVLPSLGAMVKGWLLVSPKQHVLNSSLISRELRSEFRDLLAYTREHVVRAFGSVAVFEHGASAEGSLTGCGLDHAHVHCVALPFSLQEAVEGDSANLRWSRCSGIDSLISIQMDYLAIEEQSAGTWICFPKIPISQFFRRIIAAKLGIVDRFNYQTDLFIPNVVDTKRRFEAALHR